MALEQRAYDDATGFDSIVASAGAIAGQADSAADPGVDTTIETTGAHGISARQVEEGHKITITGSAAAQYDGVKVVTRIVDATHFDIAHVYVSDTADGAFVVEKIYIMTSALLTAIGLNRAGLILDLYVAFQKIETNDKHSSDIVWLLLDDTTDEYAKGDNHMITGVKVSGNPAGTVKIVVAQDNTW